MSSMNFTCDVCGREVFSCTFVNGMKFCAKCYQEIFGETDKDRKIEKLNACVDFYKSYFVSFQEKIIDELERVKEFCNNPKNRVEYEYCPNAWTHAVDKDKLMLEIDNQIKQLKEGK